MDVGGSLDFTFSRDVTFGVFFRRRCEDRGAVGVVFKIIITFLFVCLIGCVEPSIIMGVSIWLYPCEFVMWCFDDIIRLSMNIWFKNRVVLNANTLYLLCLFV